MTQGDEAQTPPGRGTSASLYVGWHELRRRVAPQIGHDRFRALIKEKLTRAGFPRFRDEWAGFYWPSVQRWLDHDNGLGSGLVIPQAEDGPENFDATPRRKATRKPKDQQR